MNVLAQAARELWGLFVDDGSLAVALLLWCAICGLALPHIGVGEAASAVLLALGVLGIFAENVLRSAGAMRRPRKRS